MQQVDDDDDDEDNHCGRFFHCRRRQTTLKRQAHFESAAKHHNKSNRRKSFLFPSKPLEERTGELIAPENAAIKVKCPSHSLASLLTRSAASNNKIRLKVSIS